jgi:hypothetical protein
VENDRNKMDSTEIEKFRRSLDSFSLTGSEEFPKNQGDGVKLFPGLMINGNHFLEENMQIICRSIKTIKLTDNESQSNTLCGKGLSISSHKNRGSPVISEDLETGKRELEV